MNITRSVFQSIHDFVICVFFYFWQMFTTNLFFSSESYLPLHYSIFDKRFCNFFKFLKIYLDFPVLRTTHCKTQYLHARYFISYLSEYKWWGFSSMPVVCTWQMINILQMYLWWRKQEASDAMLDQSLVSTITPGNYWCTQIHSLRR